MSFSFWFIFYLGTVCNPGMELERNLPPTLVERMNDEGEIMIFDKWRHLETNEDLSHALAIEARYNEQRSIWRPKNRNK